MDVRRWKRPGFLFTDRETVEKAEKMKVCTCLNPLHTALAVFGCLLGYKKISEEMKDRDLVSLLRRIGYEEGLPAVTDPGILDPREFLDTVLTVRFPNPFLPDSPQRIATDTSQKLSVRFGETIKTYMESPDLDMDRLRGIPLVLAGWLRYRMAVDDDGRPMELSRIPWRKGWDGSWNGYSWEAVSRWSISGNRSTFSGQKVCRDQRSGKPSGRSCRMRRSLEWIFLRPDWQTG